MKKRRRYYCILLVFCLLIMGTGYLYSQEPAAGPSAGSLTLDYAVMCESLEVYTPKNIAVVFSLGVGKVLCFTSFDNVPEETVIYHHWYRKEQLSSTRKLTLKSPRWSTFSGIQFRETDKGPWRVEITDNKGNIMRTLRFSITD
jgi:hypothetical protein